MYEIKFCENVLDSHVRNCTVRVLSPPNNHLKPMSGH